MKIKIFLGQESDYLQDKVYVISGNLLHVLRIQNTMATNVAFLFSFVIV